MVGAPDFIAEVLCPLSILNDRVEKRDLYERHGVTEYWVINPVSRTTFVHRLGSDGKYGEIKTLDDTSVEELSSIPGVTIRLSQLWL